MKLPVHIWQQRALLFFTSLCKVAPGTVMPPDGLIHSSPTRLLFVCPCQLMCWDELLGCVLCFVICDMPWLTPVPDGFQGQSLSRSKSVWPAYRAVFEQHCTYWQREKLTWSLWSVLAGALELIKLLAVQHAGQEMEAGSHLWDCCREGQKDVPAGSCWQKISGLAWLTRCCGVNLSKLGYFLWIIWFLGEISESVQHETERSSFYPLEASSAPAPAGQHRAPKAGKAPWPLQMLFVRPCGTEPANQDGCTIRAVSSPSSIPLSWWPGKK